MSTTLIVLVPIGLLAVAWSVYFVGCAFQTGGIPETPAPYSNTILGEPDLVAYWPLNDLPGPAPASPPIPLNSMGIGTAVDLSKNGHTGSYVVPPNYPNPPVAQSAPITNPTVNLQQNSIIPGDVSSGGVVDQNLFAKSADFEGGYVSIPWSMQNSPQLAEFTFEAWIKPHWTGTGFARVLFGAIASNNTGFLIAVENTHNFWQFIVGNGTTSVPFTSNVQVDPAIITYVAVTFDKSGGGTINLWINPQAVSEGGDSSMTPPPIPPPPNWTSAPNPTNYAATDPTQQQVTFFIGAGRNDQPPRTTPGDTTGGPENPFQGQIQSVALYDSVLSASDILAHFQNGSSAP